VSVDIPALVAAFLSLVVTDQLQVLREIGIDTGPPLGPRETRDRMPDLLNNVHARGLVADLDNAVRALLEILGRPLSAIADPDVSQRVGD
jgi:hypothetical protein